MTTIRRDQGARMILGRIRAAFARWRRTEGRRGGRYPKTLRGLAVAGTEEGLLAGHVALAAGVSRQSVVNWSRYLASERSRRVPPVELKLVTAPEESGGGPEAHDGPGVGGFIAASAAEGGAAPVARIRFRSGASLELAVSSVDARLVSALNGAGAP